MTPAIVVAACAFVLWQMKPELLFASTTPTGADLGGQVWGPAQLREHILPSLSGWSPEWFAGLPTYVLYMPLPALVVIFFNIALPYGVAFKLTVALGAVALPGAAWALGRLSRLPSPIPACLAVAVLPFLFDDSYFRWGGNIVSSVAGEYAYQLGVLSFLVALGLIDIVLRTGRWRATAALVSAFACLCHPFVALMVLICGSLLIAAHALRVGTTAVRRVAPLVVVVPLLSAFWFLPFVWYRSELDPLPHSLDGGWTAILFPLPAWAEVIIVGLAVAGIVRAVRGRHPASLTLVGTALICGAAVLVFPRGWVGGWTSQQSLALTAARMLPFWYLAVVLLAGLGAGDLVLRASARWPSATAVGPIAGLVVAVMALGIVTGTLPLTRNQNITTPQGLVTHSKWLFMPQVETSLVPLWVSEGFGGYEREPNWSQYHSLMQAMSKVGAKNGCGRALPEDDPSGMYGSIFEFSLLPYWTNGCIDAMWGIPEDESRTFSYVELALSLVSSSTEAHYQPGVEFQSLDVRRGIPLLQELGVRYYLAFTPMAKSEASSDPTLRLIATSGPWKIYEIRGVAIVQGLSHQPVVVSDGSKALKWLDATAPWFLNPVNGAQPAAGGPVNWSRVSDASTAPRGAALPHVTVSQVTSGRNSISFHVDRIGVPVEVRTTYFPWWSAHGAQGPWRLAPNDLVVIPTSHNVVLSAKPRLIDHLAVAISLVAVLMTALLAIWDKRRRKTSDPE